MINRVDGINKRRENLSRWLMTQTWCQQVFSSDANFILFRCTNEPEKTRLFNLLVSHHILIRDQSAQPQLENCLRISIGSEKELAQLQEVLS
jgi:histidinol-phosphate aminotransferase